MAYCISILRFKSSTFYSYRDKGKDEENYSNYMERKNVCSHRAHLKNHFGDYVPSKTTIICVKRKRKEKRLRNHNNQKNVFWNKTMDFNATGVFYICFSQWKHISLYRHCIKHTHGFIFINRTIKTETLWICIRNTKRNSIIPDEFFHIFFLSIFYSFGYSL